MAKRGRGRPRKLKKRGRKAFRNLSAGEQLRKAKERNLKLGLTKRRKYVYIICSRCNQERKINTTNHDLYTKEVRENFKCIICTGRKL